MQLKRSKTIAIMLPSNAKIHSLSRLQTFCLMAVCQRMPIRPRSWLTRVALCIDVDEILYYLEHKDNHRKRVVVLLHLRNQLLEEHHRRRYGGHFSGPKVYSAMAKKRWWNGMYTDVLACCKRCPECTVVTGAVRQHRPLLHPVTIQRPFQIVGLDVMNLPCTEAGNKHAVVFQDMFTKWPMVYAVLD